MILNVNADSIAIVDNNDIFNGQGGDALAVLNMGHTFTWGGITSVTDADTGEPITDWTLTSASGTDWATLATPEPSSLVCAAIGIACSAWAAPAGIFVARERISARALACVGARCCTRMNAMSDTFV